MTELQMWGPGPYDNEVAQLWLGVDESSLGAVDLALITHEFLDLLESDGATEMDEFNRMALRLRAAAQFLVEMEPDPDIHRSPSDLVPLMISLLQFLPHSAWLYLQPDPKASLLSVDEQIDALHALKI